MPYGAYAADALAERYGGAQYAAFIGNPWDRMTWHL